MPHPSEGAGVLRLVLASFQECTGRVRGGDGQAIHPCPVALNSVTKSSQQTIVPFTLVKASLLISDSFGPDF